MESVHEFEAQRVYEERDRRVVVVDDDRVKADVPEASPSIRVTTVRARHQALVNVAVLVLPRDSYEKRRQTRVNTVELDAVRITRAGTKFDRIDDRHGADANEPDGQNHPVRADYDRSITVSTLYGENAAWDLAAELLG